MINRSRDDSTEVDPIDPDMADILAIDEPDEPGRRSADKVSEDLAKIEVRETVRKESPLPEVLKIEDKGVTSEEAKALIAEGESHIASGEIIAARVKLNDVLNLELSNIDRHKVKATMAELSNDWLFSKKPYDADKLVTTYFVRSGDNLESIGRKYKVEYQLLVRINGLSSDRALRAGSTIKVVNGPFHVIVDRSSFTLDLYLQNTFVKSYYVGLGRDESETPVGRWRVKSGGKLVQPPWWDQKAGKTYYASDADYPLGARWIAIEGLDENTKSRTGFALHGTKEPETIRTKSSNGCIRLINEDVIELYALLSPVHSLVRIVD